MNVVIPPLIAGTILPGNTEGVNPLLGGSQGAANGNGIPAGQSFLDVFAALTAAPGVVAPNATQPAQVEGGQAKQGEGVAVQDDALAAAYAELANLLAPQTAGNGVVLPKVASSQLATQTVNATNQVGQGNVPVLPVQVADVVANVVANVVSIPAPELTQLPAVQTPDVAIAPIVLPEQVVDVTTENTAIPQTVVNQPVNTNPEIVIANPVNQTIDTLPIYNVPVNAGGQKDINASQVVAVVPTEGEILLPASFVATGTDEQAIVTLPGNLKVSDIASQQAFNDINTPENTVLQNTPTVLTNAVKNNTPEVQPKADDGSALAHTFDSAPETTTDQLLQANLLLGNKLYKKAEDTLQQKPFLLSNIIQDNTNGTSVPDNAGQGLVIKLQKVASNTVATLPADSNDSIAAGNTALADKGGAPLTPTNTVAQAVPGTQTSDALSVPKQALPQATPVEQITIKVAHALKDDTKKITIHLEPVSLGKVDIRMELTHDGKASISILVDRPETMELLQRDAKQLQNALNDAGVKADAGSLNFSMRGGNEQQGRYGNPEGFQHYSNNQLTNTDDTLLSEIQAYIGGVQAMQGIDIRV